MEQVETILESGTSYIVGSGSLPPGVPGDQYAGIGELAREYDVRFILDTSGDFLRSGLNARLYLIKPNLRELGQILDRKIETDREIRDVSSKIVGDEMAENVVVSIGAGGAFLINENHQFRYRAPTVSIESKVGASDSMVEGIVFGLLRTDSVREAVRYGVAAGSAAVKTPGTELCHHSDVHELYERVEVTTVKKSND